MKLKQLFQIPTEIMEAIKTLIFFKDDMKTTIFDGFTKKLVCSLTLLLNLYLDLCHVLVFL